MVLSFGRCVAVFIISSGLEKQKDKALLPRNAGMPFHDWDTELSKSKQRTISYSASNSFFPAVVFIITTDWLLAAGENSSSLLCQNWAVSFIGW